ncbi:hypothetical protein FNU76_16160 [Chitinimonas arctica]|uniref:Phosphate ABC transporter substrate-binding protein n=1 Tax=Chitinimonas arctica TaxID=2594795 RepID=A0A516SI97_9NEIS|nr:hypothetical protein [Chitinimonas arctica]QDQ27758.1 hypothetical protein FNU76_16160 [Chitinimonas arctica]
MKLRHCALLALLAGAAQATEIAVIVHPQAGVETLSADEIAQLFLGKSNSFANGQVVIPVEQSAGPLRDEFSTRALNKSATAVRAFRAKLQFTGKAVAPKEIGSSADVKKFVASNPNSIGYIDKAAVDGSVKAIAHY